MSTGAATTLSGANKIPRCRFSGIDTVTQLPTHCPAGANQASVQNRPKLPELKQDQCRFSARTKAIQLLPMDQG
jgi:hypothetical protein